RYLLQKTILPITENGHLSQEKRRCVRCAQFNFSFSYWYLAPPPVPVSLNHEHPPRQSVTTTTEQRISRRETSRRPSRITRKQSRSVRALPPLSELAVLIGVPKTPLLRLKERLTSLPSSTLLTPEHTPTVPMSVFSRKILTELLETAIRQLGSIQASQVRTSIVG